MVLIDDFESGLGDWSGNNATIDTSFVYEGSQSVRFQYSSAEIIQTNPTNKIEPDSLTTFYFLPRFTTSQIDFRWARTDSSNYYYLQFQGSDNFRIGRRVSGTATVFGDSFNNNLSNGTWHKVELLWESNGNMEVTVTDMDTSNVKISVTTSDTTYTSGAGHEFGGQTYWAYLDLFETESLGGGTVSVAESVSVSAINSTAHTDTTASYEQIDSLSNTNVSYVLKAIGSESVGVSARGTSSTIGTVASATESVALTVNTVASATEAATSSESMATNAQGAASAVSQTSARESSSITSNAAASVTEASTASESLNASTTTLLNVHEAGRAGESITAPITGRTSFTDAAGGIVSVVETLSVNSTNTVSPTERTQASESASVSGLNITTMDDTGTAKESVSASATSYTSFVGTTRVIVQEALSIFGLSSPTMTEKGEAKESVDSSLISDTDITDGSRATDSFTATAQGSSSFLDIVGETLDRIIEVYGQVRESVNVSGQIKDSATLQGLWSRIREITGGKND